MDPRVAAGPAQLDRLALPRANNGAHALGHHQCTDHAEEKDVGNAYRDVELADRTQRGEQPDAESRADYAPRKQHEREREIDRPALPVADRPGHGRSGDMAGDACHSDRR